MSGVLLTSTGVPLLQQNGSPIGKDYTTRGEIIANTDEAHFPHALYGGTRPAMVHFQGAARDRAYIVFQDYLPNGYGGGTGGHPFVCYYDYDTATFHGPWQIGTSPIAGDHHSGGSIFVDSNNRLHVFYGCHHTDAYWTRSTRSLDDASPFTGVGDFETPIQLAGEYTYPCPIVDAAAKLWLFARHYNSGTSKFSLQYQTSTNYAGPWGAASFGALTQLTESTSDYIGGPRVSLDDNNDIIVALMNWLGTTYDLFFFRYDMLQTRWEKANGTAYGTIPIPRIDAELIAADSALAGPIVAETGGNLYFLYLNRSDGKRYSRKYSAGWQAVVKVSDYYIADLYRGGFLEVVTASIINAYVVESHEVRIYHSTDGAASFASVPTIAYKYPAALGSLARLETTPRTGAWVTVGYLGGTFPTPAGAYGDAYGELIFDLGVT